MYTSSSDVTQLSHVSKQSPRSKMRAAASSCWSKATCRGGLLSSVSVLTSQPYLTSSRTTSVTECVEHDLIAAISGVPPAGLLVTCTSGSAPQASRRAVDST